MDAQLAQGIELALVGMGAVFSFLLILVLLMTVLSWFVRRFPEHDPQAASAANTTSDTSLPSPEIMAAIEKAIRQHRQSDS